MKLNPDDDPDPDPDDEARYLFGRGQALLRAMRVDVRSNSR